jgi:hypothetical protein
MRGAYRTELRSDTGADPARPKSPRSVHRGSSLGTAVVTLLVTQTDKSEHVGSAQQPSQQRQLVRATDNGVVSYRASDEAEYSGLPWRLSLAFDAEGVSRALALEGCAENIYVRPSLPPSRLVHQILTHHGVLLHANIRQRLPPISPSSHHHKLELPIEAVRTRDSFRCVRA